MWGGDGTENGGRISCEGNANFRFHLTFSWDVRQTNTLASCDGVKPVSALKKCMRICAVSSSGSRLKRRILLTMTSKRLKAVDNPSMDCVSMERSPARSELKKGTVGMTVAIRIPENGGENSIDLTPSF